MKLSEARQVVTEAARNYTIQRNCPDCLPPHHKGDFDWQDASTSSSGKRVDLYRCRNCGKEIKITRRSVKRGSPSQKRAVDKIRKTVDLDKYDIEELDEKPNTSDIWLTITAKDSRAWYEERALVRVGPRGKLKLRINDKVDKSRNSYVTLKTYFGKPEARVATPREDFDALLAIARQRVPPAPEETFRTAEAAFAKASLRDQRKMVTTLLGHYRERHGTYPPRDPDTGKIVT